MIERQSKLLSRGRQRDERENEGLRKKKRESRKGAGAARRRPASRRRYPSSRLRKPHPVATPARSQHEGANPASLPWRRPPLALGVCGHPRIVILCRRGAASIPHESTASFELPSRTPATLSRVFAQRWFPARQFPARRFSANEFRALVENLPVSLAKFLSRCVDLSRSRISHCREDFFR